MAVATARTARPRGRASVAIPAEVQQGYSATYNASLSWESGAPEADATWWSRGTVPRVLVLAPADGSQAWERVITASLGQEAAGRVVWYRRGSASLNPLPRWLSWIPASWRSAPARGRVPLTAPAEWDRPLAGHYVSFKPDRLPYLDPVRVRHAMGRAVSTSAGPRLDISGEQATSGSARELLGTEELTSKAPALPSCRRNRCLMRQQANSTISWRSWRSRWMCRWRAPPAMSS